MGNYLVSQTQERGGINFPVVQVIGENCPE
jgi:hypothetical protein